MKKIMIDLNALESSMDDYEDAVIEVSAIIKGIDFIISRNWDDFKKSRIPAISPAEYLLSYI